MLASDVMTELDTLKRRRLLFVASRPNTALIDTGPDPLHDVHLKTIISDAGHAQKSAGKTTSFQYLQWGAKFMLIFLT